MKIAYFSPLPPQRTGVADYSRELLPELVQRATVDLWVDEPAADGLPECRRRLYDDPAQVRDEVRSYDAAIYHMGNSPAHRNIYRMLLAVPGVVVMHDFVLHHFFAACCLDEQRSPGSYIEEMAYNYGEAGAQLARGALHGARQLWEDAPLRYPLNLRLLDHARGVIVHSDFTRRMICQSHPYLPVAKVNLPVTIAPPPPDATELRRRYRIPCGHVVIGSMGYGSAAKRLDVVLRAIRRLGRDDVIYLLVGEIGASLRAQVRRSGLEEMVRVTGYVDWPAFNDYCNLIDVGVDLRYPTMGESSASVCRLLGAGKPCVVSDVGWFAEVPDSCAIKLAAVPDEQALAACLAGLIADESLRHRLGASARKYILENHNAAQAAAAYVDFVRAVHAMERRQSVRRAIVDMTGAAMTEIGVGPGDDPMIAGVAEQLASLLTFRSPGGGDSEGA
jgi:glycosyltransferase involved in cell wall biosynthesis